MSSAIQSNLENLIANSVLSPPRDRRLSVTSRETGVSPVLRPQDPRRAATGTTSPTSRRSRQSNIPEEDGLFDDDDESEADLMDPHRSEEGERRVSELVSNAFSHFGRRPSVFSRPNMSVSATGDGLTDRRESNLTNIPVADRARLAKLTTIVSGAETGRSLDETYLRRTGSRLSIPRLSRGTSHGSLHTDLETAPLNPDGYERDRAAPGHADRPDHDPHMLLDPANELDPIADLHLPHDAAGHVTTNKWSAYWTEAGVLGRAAAPILGTQMLEYSLPLVSVMSIGHLSTTDLAASALGNMTAAVTGYAFLQGYISALDLVMPTAWTSSQPERVGFWLQRATICVSVLLIPIVAIWFNAEAILLFLNQSPNVSKRAALYLQWLSVGLPGYALNLMMRKYFLAQNIQNVHQVISAVVAPINLGVNYLLVWGPDPIRLGFIGAPLTTAISYNLS